MLDQSVRPLSCVECSLLEQKVDKMEVEVTKKMQERESTAQEYKRCMHAGMHMSQYCCMDHPFVHPPPCVGCSLIEQKIDQLADRAADLTKRQLERADTALEYKRCMHVCCNGDV